VFCDANINGLVDDEDVPVPSLLVVVTNTSGTFSNANWTSAEGLFVVTLPDVPDTYVDYVHPSTLPSGTTRVSPSAATFAISSTQTIVTNFFLLANPGCVPVFRIGRVFCDANDNGRINPADTPVPDVLVVVTNSSGTFSNAAFTDAEGAFSVQLPPGADLYGDYILRSSLPPGSRIITPRGQFTTPPADGSNVVTNDFLIQNPRCLTFAPGDSRCWLTAGGHIRNGRGRPGFTFSGAVNPRCRPGPAGGNFTAVSHPAKLRFRATQMSVVDCGSLPVSPGSPPSRRPFDFIDFEGVGTLQGFGGNNTNFGMVRFSARAVDAEFPGRRDRLYLRVFDGDDRTLLLTSSNTADPLAVAPLALSGGNLQLHTSGCR
jgi:hypothetical protein